MEQQIEERRRAVVAEQARDRAQRVGGDPGCDRLVHPELAGDIAGADEGGYRDQYEEKASGRDPGRVALKPARLADVEDAGDPPGGWRGDGGGHQLFTGGWGTDRQSENT